MKLKISPSSISARLLGGDSLPRSSNGDIAATAYHETGHCIVAELYFDGVEYAEIQRRALSVKERRRFPDGIEAGRTMLRPIRNADLRKFALLCVAGPTSQGLYRTPVDVGTYEHDQNTIREKFSDRQGEEIQDAIKGARKAALDLFSHPEVKNARLVIAILLQTSRRIEGSQVRECIEQANARPAVSAIGY